MMAGTAFHPAGADEAFSDYGSAVDSFNALPSHHAGVSVRIAYYRYLWTVDGATDAFVDECMSALRRRIDIAVAGGTRFEAAPIQSEIADEESRHVAGAAAALGSCEQREPR